MSYTAPVRIKSTAHRNPVLTSVCRFNGVVVFNKAAIKIHERVVRTRNLRVACNRNMSQTSTA